MVSVFLVDDEHITRQSISNNIDWNKYDINFLGCAEDGEIALPQIIDKKPDILICDIKMPFMNGLELSHEIKEKLPNTKIVIFSGYNDFEYAQNAISIGISEFLLKPLSSKDILQTVLKLRDQIQQSQSISKDVNSFEKDRRKFFTELCTGQISTAVEILQKSQNLRIELNSYFYQIILCIFDINDNISDYIYNLDKVYVSKISEDKIIFLCNASDLYELQNQKKIVYEYYKSSSYFEKGKIFDGQVCTRMTEITKSYIHALMQTYRNDIEDNFFDEMFLFERKDLLNFLRNGSIDKIKEFWQFQKGLTKALQSAIYRNYFYTELFLTASVFSEEISVNLQDTLTTGFSKDISRLYLADVDSILEFTYSVCYDLINTRDNNKLYSYAPIEVKAKKYIQDNYQDYNLTLSDVAKYLCVTPNYLSTIFKKKVSMSFSSYLTEIRINHAKKLLCYTDMKMSEIALDIGFENVNYFSSNFKKICGVTPTQYRDNKEKYA